MWIAPETKEIFRLINFIKRKNLKNLFILVPNVQYYEQKCIPGSYMTYFLKNFFCSLSVKIKEVEFRLILQQSATSLSFCKKTGKVRAGLGKYYKKILFK